MFHGWVLVCWLVWGVFWVVFFFFPWAFSLSLPGAELHLHSLCLAHWLELLTPSLSVQQACLHLGRTFLYAVWELGRLYIKTHLISCFNLFDLLESCLQGTALWTVHLRKLFSSVGCRAQARQVFTLWLRCGFQGHMWLSEHVVFKATPIKNNGIHVSFSRGGWLK